MIKELKKYLTQQMFESGLNTAQDYDGIETDEDILIYTKALIGHYKSELSPEVRSLMQEARKKLQIEFLQSFMNENYPSLIKKEKQMKYRLKKNFQNCPKGSEVVISDVSTVHRYDPRPITWYNVTTPDGMRVKLGNSLTMNVDEWVEEVKEPREGLLILYHTPRHAAEFYESEMSIEEIKKLTSDAKGSREYIKVREII